MRFEMGQPTSDSILQLEGFRAPAHASMLASARKDARKAACMTARGEASWKDSTCRDTRPGKSEAEVYCRMFQSWVAELASSCKQTQCAGWSHVFNCWVFYLWSEALVP